MWCILIHCEKDRSADPGAPSGSRPRVTPAEAAAGQLAGQPRLDPSHASHARRRHDSRRMNSHTRYHEHHTRPLARKRAIRRPRHALQPRPHFAPPTARPKLHLLHFRCATHAAKSGDVGSVGGRPGDRVPALPREIEPAPMSHTATPASRSNVQHVKTSGRRTSLNWRTILTHSGSKGREASGARHPTGNEPLGRPRQGPGAARHHTLLRSQFVLQSPNLATCASHSLRGSIHLYIYIAM